MLPNNSCRASNGAALAPCFASRGCLCPVVVWIALPLRSLKSASFLPEACKPALLFLFPPQRYRRKQFAEKQTAAQLLAAEVDAVVDGLGGW